MYKKACFPCHWSLDHSGVPQSTTPYLSGMKIQGLKSKWLQDPGRALYLACSLTCHLGVSRDSARIIYISSWVERLLLESKDPSERDRERAKSPHWSSSAISSYHGLLGSLSALFSIARMVVAHNQCLPVVLPDSEPLQHRDFTCLAH